MFTPLDYGLTKPAYTVNEILDLFPFGRTSLYAAINKGDLKATKYGSRTLFLAPDLASFLNSIRDAAAKKKGA